MKSKFSFPLKVCFIVIYCCYILNFCKSNQCDTCLSLNIQCDDCSYKPRSYWIFEGWACKPNVGKANENDSPSSYCDYGKEKPDFFYSKVFSSSSRKPMKDGNITQIKASCIQNSQRVAKNSIHNSLFELYLYKSPENSSNKSTKNLFDKELAGLIDEISVVKCCPLNPLTGLCGHENKIVKNKLWTECLCIVAAHIEGGEDSLEKLAKKTLFD